MSDRIAKLRKIVEEHQMGKVEGVLVDVFSASAILKVHDALKPENQVKFLSCDVGKMAKVAWKLLK